jgi:hypothetical protein
LEIWRVGFYVDLVLKNKIWFDVLVNRGKCNAANELYDLKGNVNLEYLRSVKTAEIATVSDDDDIPHDMPGLQPRELNDTSSDDKSIDEIKPTKASTTMQWKVPIDDSDGKKFTCQRVRAQRTKLNAKRLANRKKRAVEKQERIKNTPFIEDAYEPSVLVTTSAPIDKIPTNEDQPDTNLDVEEELFATDPHPYRTGTIIEENGFLFKERENEDQTDTNVDVEEEFFPTDPHPYRTGTIIEENGFLFKEREMDGLIFYDSLQVLDDPGKTLDIIHESDQYWTTYSGAPSLTLSIDGLVDSGCPPIVGFVDTNSDTDYLNDLSVFRPTEHEYWNDWLLDDSTARIMAQATIDNCLRYNINATDLSEVMNPLKPRMTKPTDIDYESKRKYFAHLPASVVKATFKNTTQNMRLPASSYLHKMFKSPNPSANLKRRDEADAIYQIFSDTPAINGGEKGAHLFVGKKSELTDAFKAKDNSSTEFLKCLQDRV